MPAQDGSSAQSSAVQMPSSVPGAGVAKDQKINLHHRHVNFLLGPPPVWDEAIEGGRAKMLMGSTQRRPIAPHQAQIARQPGSAVSEGNRLKPYGRHKVHANTSATKCIYAEEEGNSGGTPSEKNHWSKRNGVVADDGDVGAAKADGHAYAAEVEVEEGGDRRCSWNKLANRFFFKSGSFLRRCDQTTVFEISLARKRFGNDSRATKRDAQGLNNSVEMLNFQARNTPKYIYVGMVNYNFQSFGIMASARLL
ncbi:hypothetical protein B0H16DRAFT_1757121 [Mycena metata]|uniref:Uncharacterized protein n=1 Tax=Mycena metata TaxID=1033252 RepID=A0AAD7NUH5_9AGAR|nr:hypothetical protein B0H16DRAFT_1757121 [Mycena metata]